MPPAEHDIEVLNTLIETTLDSADGYSQAATNADQSGYKDVFIRWADDRRQVVTQLQGQVRRLAERLKTTVPSSQPVTACSSSCETRSRAAMSP